eukprot:scaffold4.g4932.t1
MLVGGVHQPRPPAPSLSAQQRHNGVPLVPWRGGRGSARPPALQPGGTGAAPSASAAAVTASASGADAVVSGAALVGGEPACGDLDAVRQEVATLRQLLVAQQALVEQQQATIKQLQGYLAAGAGAAGAPAAAAAAGAAAAAAAPSSQQPMIRRMLEEEAAAKAALAGPPSIMDRRQQGWFDARYHSTSWGATPTDFRILPRRIILVRHAESEGNVDNIAYTFLPDPKVPLTARGWQQALGAGEKIRAGMDASHGGQPYRLHFYTSPYLRSKQTYEGVVQAFSPDQLVGVQEEVQLREQDFGNFQDAEGKQREKAERLRFGRFFYRFPNGESGADVYDRMTLFEDHLVRDINAGRFANGTSLVLVTHGLALRIFLMRWLHWTVEQFMSVYNPPNAEPLVLERVASDHESRQGGPAGWIHTKALYRLTPESREVVKGCTEEMCCTSWVPRGVEDLGDASYLTPAAMAPLR